MSAGFIEFVPEYLGTALQFLSLGASEQGSDTSSRTGHSIRHCARQATALESSPAQDSNVFFVTRATADRDGLNELSDLAKVDENLTFGGPAECPSRPLCLVGLRGDMASRSERSLLWTLVDRSTRRQALRDGAIDIALLFTTDPVIDSEGFVELRDDEGLQPPENVTPLVRAEVVDRWGTELVDLVDAVSEHITTEDLRELNGRVTRGEGDIASISRWSWLAEQGLS